MLQQCFQYLDTEPFPTPSPSPQKPLKSSNDSLFLFMNKIVATEPKRTKSDNAMGMMILWLKDSKESSGGSIELLSAL